MALTQDALNQFFGTENYYQHGLLPLLYTDGVKYVADEGQAYWLIDEIASLQAIKKIRKEDFQVWTLEVDNNQGKLTCENGNMKVVYSKDIDYTDFPLDKIRFFLTNGVLLLVSEY